MNSKEHCAQLTRLALELENLATMQYAYLLRFNPDDLTNNPNFKAYQASVQQFATSIKSKSLELRKCATAIAEIL